MEQNYPLMRSSVTSRSGSAFQPYRPHPVRTQPHSALLSATHTSSSLSAPSLDDGGSSGNFSRSSWGSQQQQQTLKSGSLHVSEAMAAGADGRKF